MLRKLLVAAAIAVLSAGFAHAQVTPPDSIMPDTNHFNMFPVYGSSRLPEQVGRDIEIERNYREAVKRIPDKKPSNDPWKSIRAAPARPAATAATLDRHRAQ
jgi:hypothetical protein